MLLFVQVQIQRLKDSFCQWVLLKSIHVVLCTVPYTERVQRSAEMALFPPAAVFTSKVTTPSSTEKQPPFSHCPPQQLRSAQYELGSRNVWERSQEEEDSQDGSYLWLQRQVQWRAGSPSLSANRAVRETRDGYGETSPSSGQGGEGKRTEVSGGERESRDSMVACSTSVSISGSAEASGSMASPGAIPNFRTLQDQQVGLNSPDFCADSPPPPSFSSFVFYPLEKNMSMEWSVFNWQSVILNIIKGSSLLKTCFCQKVECWKR